MGFIIEPGNQKKPYSIHEQDMFMHGMTYEVLMIEFENVNVPRNAEEFRKIARKACMERVKWAMENFDYCFEEMLRKMFPENYPTEPNMYNGQVVHTTETWSKLNSRMIGMYVEENVVMDYVNALPPISWKSGYVQCGEPVDCKYDFEKEMWRNTYTTFKKIAAEIWEYCGDCFEGKENITTF